MNVDDLAALVARRSPPVQGEGPEQIRPFKDLGVVRYPKTTSFEAVIYRPVVCLILQGRKETTLGADTFKMGPGDCLLISHDLPVLARVTKVPYLALLLDVKLDTLRDLYDAVAERLPPPGESRALEVQKADPAVIDALHRYVSLTGSPTDESVLGPLVTKEIHYRLLMASFGGMLRNLIRHDSHASAIARAISQIRRDFRGAIAIPALARSVGMSTSSFHKHFKVVTAASPLQYQKDLRLLEARRLLRTGETSVSTAAFDVGYESPTQFSREYARKFGVPPKRDAAAAP